MEVIYEAERAHGKAAKEMVTKLIGGQNIVVTSHKMGAYGRYDAEIQFIDESKKTKDLTQVLKEAGMERKAAY
jgi:endonuclease YncB( thermonuclease family)